MRLLIDNSNLFAGGGLQVAASFARDLKELDCENEYYIVQSLNASKDLINENFPSNFYFIYLSKIEEQSIIKRIQKVKSLENKINPDAIFTTFGPSYHRSKCPKIVGFAWGFAIYPESPFFKEIPLKTNIRYKFLNKLKIFYFNRNSDVLIFETEYSQKYYRKHFHSRKKSFYVSNTLNNIFYLKDHHIPYKLQNKSKFNILFLTANYLHKNLDLLPEIIEILKSKCDIFDFKFQVSVNKEDLNFDEETNEHINYLGRVELEKLPSIYNQVDMVFMPSLLETFSTTYLEAMFMKKPLVVADLEFARDICGDSAIFCKPTDPYSFAQAIYKLYHDDALCGNLVKKGQENLKRFGDSMARTKKYLNIIEQQIKY